MTAGLSIHSLIALGENWIKIPSPRFSTAGSQLNERASIAGRADSSISPLMLFANASRRVKPTWAITSCRRCTNTTLEMPFVRPPERHWLSGKLLTKNFSSGLSETASNSAEVNALNSASLTSGCFFSPVRKRSMEAQISAAGRLPRLCFNAGLLISNPS